MRYKERVKRFRRASRGIEVPAVTGPLSYTFYPNSVEVFQAHKAAESDPLIGLDMYEGVVLNGAELTNLSNRDGNNVLINPDDPPAGAGLGEPGVKWVVTSPIPGSSITRIDVRWRVYDALGDLLFLPYVYNHDTPGWGVADSFGSAGVGWKEQTTELTLDVAHYLDVSQRIWALLVSDSSVDALFANYSYIAINPE